MPCGVDFLPSHIMELTNFVTSDELYTGSAATSRFAICPFLGIENPAFLPLFVSRPLGAQCCDFLLCPVTSLHSWGAWRRTSNGSACGWPRPPNRACRAPRDNARRADLSHVPRGLARSSAPAGCDRCRECRLLLRRHWSGGHAQPCATPSLASWAFAYKRGCIRRVAGAIPGAPAMR